MLASLPQQTISKELQFGTAVIACAKMGSDR